MDDLHFLKKKLDAAKLAYKSADSILDTSPLELILCREELKQSRFLFDKACRRHVLQTVFSESEEDICI